MIYTTPHKQQSSYILGTTPDSIDTQRKGSDRWVLISVIALIVFGILAVYSSIAFFAESNQTTAGSLIFGHIIKIGIAFITMLFISKLDYHLLARFSRYALLVSWILLIVVHFTGTEIFGARRSLDLGAFSFQPSALASLSLLFHVCLLLYKKQEYVKDFKTSFIPLMIWILPTCFLIGLEDFSTASVLLTISLLIMFIGRVHLGHLGIILVIGIVVGSALIATTPERQNRIKQYVDQIVDVNSSSFALGEGYQTQQAHIAIAKGKLFGVGIGKSTQRDFLPAPYNDFIFAIIAEEYGLFGSLALLAIFIMILFRGFVFIARKASDQLGMLMATASTIYLTLYGFINAAVACGLMPVTGLPMPFVSYGGSNMLIAGLVVGILLNISKSPNHDVSSNGLESI